MAAFIAINPDVEDSVAFNISNYEGVKFSHYINGFCLISTLISKGLNNNNYREWMTKRTRSYNVPLVIRDSGLIVTYLQPSLPVAISFNPEKKTTGISGDYSLHLYGPCQSQGVLLRSGTKITINILRNAELTNISMVMTWIFTVNKHPTWLGRAKQVCPIPLCCSFQVCTDVRCCTLGNAFTYSGSKD